ncbi:hypothetical protein BJX61DRAFT_493067 [Aspergillus egyptiacus]|nr:hypothetical protein BJX61DRAFT_493067 [Aspergillus egyptiacus]
MASVISQLSTLLHNPGLPVQLSSAVQASPQSRLFLKIEATLSTEQGPLHGSSIYLGCVDLRNGAALPSPSPTPTSTPDPGVNPDTKELTGQDHHAEASSSCTDYTETDHPRKRHKTVSGLRLPRPTGTAKGNPSRESDSQDELYKPSVRQVHSDTRFPQRRKPGQDGIPPPLEPTSTDKLLAGIWRQVHSPVELSRDFSKIEPRINIRSGVSLEVFQTVNALCLKYYNRSQSSRALEMIVQAYWIECFEARTAVLRLERPALSKTEARMLALKEACTVLHWKEKDLRNRMAIWRGYKEIKDAGGWASLIFASAGVYRFCKYRTEFGDALFSRLRQIASALELAADTLHPGWRDLLTVVQQDNTQPVYHGHPHEWVVVPDGPAVPLASTYGHLQLPNGFQYRFIDECVLDPQVFGTDDPRRVPELNPDICPVCHERQSDEVEDNLCMCFPALFGGIRTPVPVQIFQTSTGKNNGVIARCNFDRGTAIGEFTGLITAHINGLDVMIGGSRGRPYQIYQGTMGNFTRFINHSCRPNSQFQRVYWRGVERIIVVSRGVVAGSEITVDYSDRYWRELGKRCLCGEGGCRFR